MENKTKVKVAVVIGIVILAVIFILMVVFVKSNKKTNNDIPRKTKETSVSNSENIVDTEKDKEDNETNQENATLENVISLGIKDGNLVKINNDLTSTIVKKLDDNFGEFCYGDEKAYISIKENDKCIIKELDLVKENYPEKTIFSSSDFDSINCISYYGGKLYFVTEYEQLIEYSISEEYSKNLSNKNEVSFFVIDKNKNNMYVSYKPNGENPGIYLLDFTLNNYTQKITLSNLTGKLYLGDNTLVIDVKEVGKLYAYNIDSNSIVEIGNDNSQIDKQIAFFGNVMLYANNTVIDLKDSNGNSYQDKWYDLEDREIYSIDMISTNILNITILNNDKTYSCRSIDLTTGGTGEVPENVYLKTVRID